MSVAVYPRLGALLRARNLSVAELGRQITLRYGLPVDADSLDQWVREAPIRRADLEIAAAAAAVLGVSLADLFEADLAPIFPPEEPVLDAAQADRLAELLDAQQARALSATERGEMDALVAEYSRRLQERGLPEIATERGISLDQARREVRAEVDEAVRWWDEIQADAGRKRAVLADLKRRRLGASPVCSIRAATDGRSISASCTATC